MKLIQRFDSMLRDADLFENEIEYVKPGDVLDLKIVRKINGFIDVFAYKNDEQIGEFFNTDSTALIPFLSNKEFFQTKCVVRKKVKNREGFTAVVVDVEVFAENDFDDENFLNTYVFDKSKFDVDEFVEPVNEINQPVITSTQQNPKKKRGCFFYVMVAFAILFLLIWLLGR